MELFGLHLQSWGKILTHFVWFRGKCNPFPQTQYWFRVMLSEALSDLPTLIDGAGMDYDKSKNLCFLLNNVMPHFDLNGKHGNSSYKLQIFSSMIVAFATYISNGSSKDLLVWNICLFVCLFCFVFVCFCSLFLFFLCFLFCFVFVFVTWMKLAERKRENICFVLFCREFGVFY